MQHIYEQLNAFHLLDVKNATHPAMFVDEPLYDLFIMTFPIREGKNLTSEAHAFVFDEKSHYYYDRLTSSFIDMQTMQHVYEFLDNKTNETMKMVANIHESIDWMEEQLYENSSLDSFMRYWLLYKKDLSRMHRVLNITIESLELFLQSYLKEEDFLAIHFKDIHEHLGRTNRSILLAIDKLGNLYNFYMSRNNEKMNKMIYILTIFSAIFLPLNLMVGYFGMNTKDLPFGEVANGTSMVTSLLLARATMMAGFVFYVRKKL